LFAIPIYETVFRDCRSNPGHSGGRACRGKSSPVAGLAPDLASAGHSSRPLIPSRRTRTRPLDRPNHVDAPLAARDCWTCRRLHRLVHGRGGREVHRVFGRGNWRRRKPGDPQDSSASRLHSGVDAPAARPRWLAGANSGRRLSPELRRRRPEASGCDAARIDRRHDLTVGERLAVRFLEFLFAKWLVFLVGHSDLLYGAGGGHSTWRLNQARLPLLPTAVIV